MKRRLRRVRQLVPTRFATAYRSGGKDGKPVFVTWWMMWGRSFRVKRTLI